ncbi:hypothetical protein ACSSS7_001232 [Eimeria intestinalis]
MGVLLLRAAAAAALLNVFKEVFIRADAAADIQKRSHNSYMPGESVSLEGEGPGPAPTEYASPSELNIGAHAAQEPYSRAPMTGLLPRVYGLKTFIFGLTLMCMLIYLQLKEENGFKLRASLFEGIPPEADKLEIYKQIATRFFKQAAGPVYDPASLRSKGQVASVVLMLSGLGALIASLQRRSKAKKGQAVSYAPPQRGTVLVGIGIGMQVLFILGLLFLNQPVFLGLMQIASVFVVTAAIIFFVSAAELKAYKNGMRRAVAASATSQN